MKQFLLKIFLVLALIFIGDRLIGSYLDHLYERNYNHYSNGHLNYYLKEGKCDTLLLGSSRVLHSLNPECFGPKTYSIAQQSKHLGWFAAILDLLEQQHKLPGKTLILNIEPADFNPYYNEKLHSDIHFLKFYYNSNAFIRSEINKASPFEFIKYFSSCFRHNGEGLILITNPLQHIGQPPVHRGFSPLEPTSQDSIRVYSTIDEPEEKGDLNFRTSSAVYYFDHILKICKKNKIKLIVITTPHFSESDHFIKTSESMEKFLDKKNIRYLNYATGNNGVLSDLKYWYDNTHLNKLGALKFSYKVKADINSK